MAELLGVVASGVAVTQAAHAVGGVVFSLCRLWREVKDVPETIQNMLDELDLAGKLMAAVETELMGSASSTGPKVGGSLPSIQYLAIQRCHQVHKDLGGVIDDLSADIASSKRRKRLMAKTRVVLKKETLENYEKRLEKALRCLDSAIQLHLASSIKQQPTLIAAEITNVLSSRILLPTVHNCSNHTEDHTEKSQTFPPKRTAHQNSVSQSKTKRHSNGLLRRLGIEITETEEQSVGPSKKKSYQIRVSPAWWLMSQAWELQVSMACSGWTFHLRHYIVLPRDHELFHIVERGPLKALMELFDNGLASPLSVDPDGWTLLHHAVATRWDFVQPLAQLGLDFLVLDHLGYSSCDYYTFSRVGAVGGFQDLAIHRLMLSYGAYDELSIVPGNIFTEKSLAITQMARSVEHFESFRGRLCPDFYRWPLEARADLAYRSIEQMNWKVFARFFDPGGRFRPEHLRCRLPFALPRTVLQEFTSIYFLVVGGIAPYPEGFTDREGNAIRPVMREMVSVMETSALGEHSLLAQGVLSWRDKESWPCGVRRRRANRWPWKYLLRVFTQTWAEDLQAAGHDLEVYGKAEMAAFRRLDLSDSIDWFPKSLHTRGSSQGPYRLKGFKYGPRPEHWDLIWAWDPAVEEFVGDFWAWVENPPLVVPGAWVDDDEDW